MPQALALIKQGVSKKLPFHGVFASLSIFSDVYVYMYVPEYPMCN